MAGSLKVVIPTAQRGWFFTPTFPLLNAATKFTAMCWYEVASIGPEATNSNLAAASNSWAIGVQNINQTINYAASAGAANEIRYLSSIVGGHFGVLSYDGSGTTTMYVDGAVVATFPSMGVTDAVDQAMQVGLRDTGAAVTLYFKDMALWGGYSATQADVIALRDGVSTPATLATPANNWWSLQGTPGATAAVNADGLIDTIGGVNFTSLSFTAGTATYDAHEIAISSSSLMMPPFCDTSGNLVIIPVYGNPLVTTGGPAIPTAIVVPPVFKKNGSVITPTLIPLYSSLYAIIYQLPSTLLSTDVLTMAAPLGWASTNFGIISGTGSGGTPGAPLTVVNNAGQAIESIYAPAKVMKVGYNVAAFGNADNAPGQARANWVSRIEQTTDGWLNALTFHANGLPATISGTAAATVSFDNNNNVDANGTPSIEGLWTLAYGDSSVGVSSSGPNQVVELTFNASWHVDRLVTNPGSWNGSAWVGVVKTYHGTYVGPGTYNHTLALTITSGNGNVDFPSKGNGQVELGIFPPSPANRNVSSPINWDPLAVDPEYLLKLRGASVIRWMAGIAGFQFDGDSSMKVVGDLAQRQVNDFLWTTSTTTTTNVIKAEPIGATFAAFIDYLNATQTMSADNWNLAGQYTRVPMLLTTNAPHGLSSGGLLVMTGTTAAPQPAVKQDNLRLASAIAATGSPASFTVDNTAPMLVGDVILIGTEQMTVTAAAGINVTVTRPTAGTSLAAHSIGDVVYVNFLTASATAGATTLTVSRTGYPFGLQPTVLLQIDSEQVSVATNNSSTSITVTRGINGTTAASHAIGALVKPVMNLDTRNTKVAPMVIDSTRFVIGITHGLLPTAFPTALSNPTLEGTTNFTTTFPSLAVKKPFNNGSVPYEFAAKTTNTIAAANGYPTTLWINVSVMATDALVTEIVANRVIPYIGSNVNLIIEIGNEIWNSAGVVYATVALLAPTAPNPDTPSAPFANSQQWVASRQNHVTNLAKAAFTAAGLDPARVYNFQPAQHQVNPVQGISQANIAYCQTHGIPIDLLTIDGYVDISTTVWNLWWSWMPTADGGSASWSRATARRVIMAYFRAWCWFSQYFGGAILANAQLLSWYKAGKLVSANGVGSGAVNTGLGKLCYYESATEFVTGVGDLDPSTIAAGGKTAQAGNFVHPNAMEHDLVYDGIPQWTGDTGWKATETAYIASKQGAADMYAALMPSASFPDPTSGIAAFTCLFANTYVWGGQGQGWFTYAFQSQPPGDGAANVMTVPDGTAWSGATPVEQARVNQSVRAQAAIDWIGATSGGGGGGGGSSSGAALLMSV